MRAVPRSLREASYGLGARKVTTALRVVVPAAVSGIVAALILGISRARSARRWSWPSRPAAPAARCARSTRSTRADDDGRHGRRSPPAPTRSRATRPRSRACSSSGLAAVRASPSPSTSSATLRPPHAAAVLGARDDASAPSVTAARASGPALRAAGRATGAGIVFQVLLARAACCSRWSILVVLLVDVLSRALPVFAERGVDFLTSPAVVQPGQGRRQPGPHGARSCIGVIVVDRGLPARASPTAVYLEEYAPATRGSRGSSTINIRNLAGVPSVVYGLLGLPCSWRVFKALGIGNGRNIIAGGADARGAGAADRDHHLGRGAARRAQQPSARRATASAPRAGR